MVRASINGQTAESSQVIGSATRCMDKVCLPGLMVEDTRVIIMMIRNKEMVSLNGQMVGSMMEHG